MWLSPMRLKGFLALLLVLGFTAPAAADVFRAAEYGLLPEEDPLHYIFTAQVPSEAASNAEPVWPTGCQSLSRNRQMLGKRLQYSFELECSDVFTPDAKIVAPWSVDGVTFYTSVMGESVQTALPGGSTGVALPLDALAAAERSVIDSAQYYTWQGMVHIWIGWDHLAFVLCLCLVSRGKQLLWLVTAFTLGHSISLALAFFQVVSIPIPPVEAIIALSIALMAREAILYSKRSDGERGSGGYAVIVSAFGLLHGLGFASALGALGVAAHERVTGLIFFNIGVEIGQLLFVGAVSLALLGLRQVSLAQPARFAAAWGAGVVGCYWTIERVAGFPWA